VKKERECDIPITIRGSLISQLKPLTVSTLLGSSDHIQRDGTGVSNLITWGETN